MEKNVLSNNTGGLTEDDLNTLEQIILRTEESANDLRAALIE